MRSLFFSHGALRVLFLLTVCLYFNPFLYSQLITASDPRYYEIILGDNEIDSLLLINSGNKQISWSLSHSYDWIRPEQTGGDIQPRDTFVLPIKLQTNSLPLASYLDTIHLSTLDSHIAVSIPIHIRLDTDSHLEVNSDTLIQSLRVDEVKSLYFDMRNIGKTDLDYRLFSDISFKWLEIESSIYGIMPPHSNKMMSILLDASDKIPGEYLGKIWVTSNDKDNPRKALWIKMIVLPEAATVKLDLPDNKFCAGEVTELSYEVISADLGPFNVFQIELSDPKGNFEKSSILADIQADSLSGKFSIHIPDDIVPGEGYSIRMNASSPPLKGKIFAESIRIAAKPQLQFAKIPSLCRSDLPFELTEALPIGGRYVGEGIIGDTLRPSELRPGTHSILYEYVSDEGCEAMALQEIEILPPIHVTHAQVRSFCENEVGAYISAGTPRTGQYSGKGVRTDGYFDPKIAGPGTHQLQYTASNGKCQETISFTVTVNPTPQPMVPEFTLARSSPALDLNHANQIGGVFLGEIVKDGKIYPESLQAGEYPVTYYYTTNESCIVTTKTKVIIYDEIR